MRREGERAQPQCRTGLAYCMSGGPAGARRAVVCGRSDHVRTIVRPVVAQGPCQAPGQLTDSLPTSSSSGSKPSNPSSSTVQACVLDRAPSSKAKKKRKKTDERDRRKESCSCNCAMAGRPSKQARREECCWASNRPTGGDGPVWHEA
jgi:hypothetical protein